MCIRDSAGDVRNGHAGEELRLQAVGLEGVEFAQDGPQFFCLGGGDRVGEEGDPAVLRQPLQGRLGDVGVRDHQLGVGEKGGPGLEKGGGQVVVDLHVRDGQLHVPVGPGQVQVGGGGPVGDLEGLTDVDAQFTAGGGELLGGHVVPKGGEKPGLYA